MFLKNMQKENVIVYKVENEDNEKTLKKILKNKLNLSSRLLSKLKRDRSIFVNGKYTKYCEEVKVGDEIKVVINENPNHFIPQDIPFKIAYEDVDLILANKQPGIVTHPTKSHSDNTIANAASWYLTNKEIDCKIRFVNRLDMNTSGLIIIAKSSYSHNALSQQMKENSIQKKYIAFVWGNVKDNEGRIEAPICRSIEDPIKRTVDEKGQASTTEYKVLERYKNATMLEVKLLTGRTHQIRVHMSYIGHPLIGDTLYGKDHSKLIERQALHAVYLQFLQPRYKKQIEVEASLPEDLLQLKEKLKNKYIL